MADHSVVFNMRVQLPGAAKDVAGQISYEQMMATFDRTRNEGVKEGWQKAMMALREAVETEEPPARDASMRLLDAWINEAAKSVHCPRFFE